MEIYPDAKVLLIVREPVSSHERCLWHGTRQASWGGWTEPCWPGRRRRSRCSTPMWPRWRPTFPQTDCWCLMWGTDGIHSVSSSTIQSPTSPSPTSTTPPWWSSPSTSSGSSAGWWWSSCPWSSPSSSPDVKLSPAESLPPFSCLESFRLQDNSLWQLSKSMQGKRSDSISSIAPYILD